MHTMSTLPIQTDWALVALHWSRPHPQTPDHARSWRAAFRGNVMFSRCCQFLASSATGGEFWVQEKLLACKLPPHLVVKGNIDVE